MVITVRKMGFWCICVCCPPFDCMCVYVRVCWHSRPSHHVAVRVYERFHPRCVRGDEHLSVWCTFNRSKLHYPVSCFSVTVYSTSLCPLLSKTHTNTNLLATTKHTVTQTSHVKTHTLRWNTAELQQAKMKSTDYPFSPPPRAVVLRHLHIRRHIRPPSHPHTRRTPTQITVTRACSDPSPLPLYISRKPHHNGWTSQESSSTATRPCFTNEQQTPIGFKS